MSKELIVSATRHETRVAILEDDQLVEIFYQREQEYSLAGSIHKGRVTRVLPGMQSAFVDIGLERDAFLYVSDFFEDNEEYDKIVSGVEDKILKLDKGTSLSPASTSSASSSLPSLPIEPEIAAVLGAVPGAIPGNTAPANTGAPAPMGSNGAAGEPRRDGRDGRDGRGGRGRRGRRRRPGQGGGLPESKFFSPREGRESREPRESRDPRENREPREAREPRAEHRSASPTEGESEAPSRGLSVLPGESISKYVGQAPSLAEPAELEDDGPSDVDMNAPSAIPDSDAIGGGAYVTASVVTEEVFAASVEISEEPLLEAEDAAADQDEEDDEPENPFAYTTADDDEADTLETIEGEAPEMEMGGAADLDTVDESETEQDAAEVFEDGEPGTAGWSAEAQLAAQPLEAQTGVSHSSETVTDEVDRITEEEGPEPARIPQSLTAALREQGGRLPHRMSRRMRRRMRGGERSGNEQQPGVGAPEGEESAANGSAAALPVNEQASVSAPSTIAPLQAERRGGRGGRDREERNRGGEAREGRGEDRGNREPREERSREPREPREDRPREDRPREVSREREEVRPPVPSITDLLRSGQEIIVQIAKEPLGQKGARITSHIALPGRFLVYMPTVDHIGVSRKIPSDEERQRLKRILQTHRTGIPGGFIVRTAGENRTEEELRTDMMFLYTMWMDMRQKAEKKPAPFLLHHDLDVVERILRDQLTSAFKTVWVDNETVYESVLSFIQRFQPAMVNRVKLYTRPTPIFDEFGITQELEKALRPKVWLKSGGYIVINQTEALVAIDINTGKYVGKSNRLEDTIVKINTDAIKEIVRQIRLRDLGGIIVVDFIDMDERKNRQKVMQALEESMRVDRAPYKILQFNDFGLVAITRKRVKQSLERTLCAPCPYCEGAGYVKSVSTVISEVLQEAHKIVKAVEGDSVVLRVNPEVAKVLKSNSNDHLEEIESILGKTVLIKSDPLLHQTKFDLA